MNDDLVVTGTPCPFAIQAAYTAVRGGEPGCPDMLVLPVLEAAELNGTAPGPGAGQLGSDNTANRLLSSLNSFDQNRLKELNRQEYFFCTFDPLKYVVQVIYSKLLRISIVAMHRNKPD